MTASRLDSHSSRSSTDLEPLRLLAGGGSLRERLLLESADLDAMPSTTVLRLARALAVPPEGGPPGAPAPARRSLHLGKGLLLGGVGAIATVGFMAAWLTNPAEPALPVRVAAPAHVAAPVSTPATAWAPVAPMMPMAPAASPTAADVANPARPPEASRIGTEGASPRPRPVPQPSASRAGSRLLEEARLLEKARSSLRAGKNDAAERSLADYHTRFARGELALEAQLLDVDRLLARGENLRAGELARKLVSREDAARYRPRLEAQLQRAHGTGATAATSLTSDGSERGSSHMDQRRHP